MNNAACRQSLRRLLGALLSACLAVGSVPLPSRAFAATEGDQAATQAASSFSAPAVELSGRADSTVVHVSAPEGSLPEGVSLGVEAVDAEAVQELASAQAATRGMEVRDLVAIRAKLLDREGNEIQPAIPVTLTFLNTDVTGDEVHVYRVDPEAGSIQEAVALEAEPGVQTIEAAATALFAITGEGSPESRLITYSFTALDGTVISNQVVRSGNVLYAPDDPFGMRDDDVFEGWYADNAEGGRRLVFGSDGTHLVSYPSDYPTAGDVVKVSPRFESFSYVTFVGEDGHTVVGTKAAVAGDTVSTADVSADTTDPDDAFAGWSFEPGAAEPDVPDELEVGDQDVTLYPVFSTAYTVNFSENDGVDVGGAAYTPSQRVISGQRATRPEDPAFAGHKFLGWYTEPEGGEEFSFRTRITADRVTDGALTLYAHWKETTATYTVVYWNQKVTDSKTASDAEKTYDYAGSTVLEGPVGADVSDSSRFVEPAPRGFIHNESQDAAHNAGAVIEANGTTVVNVHYDRELVTLVFKGIGSIDSYTYTATNADGDDLYGIVNGSYVRLTHEEGGHGSYRHGDEPYEGLRYVRTTNGMALAIAGLYGQSLEQSGVSWPGTVDGQPVLWFDGAEHVTFLDTFDLPGGGTSMELTADEAGPNVMNFYKQAVDGSYPASPSNTVNVPSGEPFSITDKYAGFHASEYRVRADESSDWGPWLKVGSKNEETGRYGGEIDDFQSIEVRYERSYYTVSFVNGTGGTTDVPMQCGAALAAVEVPKVGYPGSEASAEYTLAGWFADPELSTYVSFESLSDEQAQAKLAELQDNYGSGIKQVVVAGTMPAGDVSYYAGWFKNWYEVKLEINDSPEAPAHFASDDQSDYWWMQSYGTVDSSLLNATREGYVLAGWMVGATRTEDGGWNFDKARAWNFADGVTKANTTRSDRGAAGTFTLVALWKSVDSLRISADGGKTTLAQAYADLSYAKAPTPSAEIRAAAPEGHVFVGWRRGEADKNLYVPGKTLPVDARFANADRVIVLVPVYQRPNDRPGSITLTYEPNGGSGSSITLPGQPLTASFAAKPANVFGAPELSSFAFWNNEPDGSGYLTLRAEANAAVADLAHGQADESGGGNAAVRDTLYAQWVRVGLVDDVTYDGQAHEPKPSVTFLSTGQELVEGEDYVLSWSGETTDVTAEGVAVHVTFRGRFAGIPSVVRRYRILPIACELAVTATSYAGVYDGQPHTVVATASVEEGTTLEYRLDAGAWTKKAPALTDATEGERVVEVRATNPNYEDAEIVSATIQILRRPLTIRGFGWADALPYKGVAYKSESFGIESPSVDRGLVEGHHADGLTYSILGTAAGTYEGAFGGSLAISDSKVDVTDNYEVNLVPGTLVITKAASNDLGLQASGYLGVYDGEPHGVQATAVPGATVQYSTTGGTTWTTEVPTITYVGSRDILVRATSPNHEDAYAHVTLEVTPLEATVTANVSTKTYGDADPKGTLTATVTGTIGQDRLSYTMTRELGEDVGTYAVTPGGSRVQGNYVVTFVPGSLTVTKAGADAIDLEPLSAAYPYDGAPHEAATATATGVRGELLAVQYSVDGATWLDSPSDIVATHVADTQSVMVRATSPNYEGYAEGTQSLAITPRKATVAAEAKNKVLGTADPELTAMVSGVLEGESLSFSLDREPGEDAGSYVVTPTGDAEQGDYRVAFVPSKLAIMSDEVAQIEIVTQDVRVTYDGQAHEAGVATATGAGGEQLEVQYSADNGSTWTSDPGTIVARNVDESNLAILVRAGGSAYDGQYRMATQALEVTKRPVSFVGKEVEVPYTGSEQVSSEYVAQGLVEGHEANVVAKASRVGAGTTPGTISAADDVRIVAGDKDVTQNYDISCVPGSITVTPTDIAGNVKLVPIDISTPYDGLPHVAGKARAFTANGTTESILVEYSVDGEHWTQHSEDIVVTDVGDSHGHDAPILVRASGPNYTGYVEATQLLEVTPRHVSVRADSFSKTYLEEDPELTVATSNVVAGESIDFAVSREPGEDVGEYAIVVEGERDQGNYSVSFVDGTFVIGKAPASWLSLVAHGYEGVYDGQPHGAWAETGVWEGTTIEYLADGSSWSTTPPTITHAGTLTYVVRATNPNYETATVTGMLRVDPAPLVVTTASAAKPYDGTPLRATEDAVAEGFVGDETATLMVSGERTDVGRSTNGYRIAWTDSSAADYAVTERLGTLVVTINDTPVTLVAASEEKVYDGTILERLDGVVAEGLPPALTVDASSTGSQIEAGSSRNVIDEGWSIRDAEGKDVTVWFTNVTTSDGILTVHKAPLVVSTGSATDQYTGKPLTSKVATLTGLQGADLASVTATGAQVEVGSSANTYVIDWDTGNENNYEVIERLGTLEVTRNVSRVSLVAGSASKTYDGTPLTCDDIAVTGLPEGFTFEGTTSGSATNVSDGLVMNSIDDGFVIKNAAGEDRTDCFTFLEMQSGIVGITPRKVILTSATASKPYDEAPLEDASVVVGGEGFADGEGATFEVTGSQTLPGTSENLFAYELDEGVDAQNYDVQVAPGTLTVTSRDARRSITVEANSASFTYDGAPHTVSGFKQTSFVFDGLTYQVTGLMATASAVDAGEYPVNVVGTPKVVDSEGVDVTEQFAVSVANGVLTIDRREVTLTSGSVDQVYNGMAVYSSTVSVGGDGWASGEGASYLFDSLTSIGEKPNTFAYLLNDGTKESNYDISVMPGTLRMRKVETPLVIVADSATKSYDGHALLPNQGENGQVDESGTYDKGYTFNEDALVTGDMLEVTVSGSQTFSGTSKSRITSYRVVRNSDSSGLVDVTDRYASITTVDGTLTVEPRVITVHTGGGTKRYDGEPFGVDAATVRNLANDETLTIRATGSQTEVGTSKNSYKITWNGTASSTNYTIQEVLGDLTVVANSQG